MQAMQRPTPNKDSPLKNKEKTYVLLVLVLAIWGIIGYRIVTTINPKTPEVSKEHMEVAFNPNINTQMDTFSIQRLDRDPFLGTIYKKKTVMTPKMTKPMEPVVWPNVVFHGVISKQDSKEKLCVLSINSIQQILKIGQSTDGIKLIRATNQEALVSFKNQRKAISKS